MKRYILMTAAFLVGYFVVGPVIIHTIKYMVCPHERYVALANETLPKAVMIEVDTIMPVVQFTFDGSNLSIHESTVPATIMGAGVFISSKGHILTCGHLFTVGPTNAVRVFEVDGSSVPATVLYVSTSMDLGLLTISSPTVNYASLTTNPLEIGEEVLAIGNPLGLKFSVSHGIISAFRPDFDQGFTFTQNDAAINHGNSGGPLFNLRGELVGINTLKASDSEGLAFSVAPSTIKAFLSLFTGVPNGN